MRGWCKHSGKSRNRRSERRALYHRIKELSENHASLGKNKCAFCAYDKGYEAGIFEGEKRARATIYAELKVALGPLEDILDSRKPPPRKEMGLFRISSG